MDYVLAEKFCRQAIHNYPDESRYFMQLGRALHKKGDIEKAIKYYERSF